MMPSSFDIAPPRRATSARSPGSGPSDLPQILPAARDRAPWLLLICSALGLSAACADPAPPPALQVPSASATPALPAAAAHSLPDHPGEGYGCEPTGPQRALRGVIHVEPIGKGLNGARLDDGAKRWVVSYRADATLIALDGKSVEALGRPCVQRAQSIDGPHFDVQTVTPVD